MGVVSSATSCGRRVSRFELGEPGTTTAAFSMPGVARRPLVPRHAAFVRHPWLRRAVFAAPPAALQRVRWRSTAPDEEPDFLSAVRAERNFVARREGRLRQLALGIP